MDTDDYNELTSQLDAREILRYLNHLGIHNISGEVLKYFITGIILLNLSLFNTPVRSLLINYIRFRFKETHKI